MSENEKLIMCELLPDKPHIRMHSDAEQLASLHSAHDLVCSENNQLRARIVELNAKVSDLGNTGHRLLQEKYHYKHRIAELEQQLADMTADRDAAVGALRLSVQAMIAETGSDWNLTDARCSGYIEQARKELENE